MPFVRKRNGLNVPFDLLSNRFLPDEGAVFAPLLFTFVRAAVAVETQATSLCVAFGGDAVATRGAGGEVEEEESFVTLALTRSAYCNPRGLNFIEGFFRNHRKVRALMDFSLVDENAVIEGVGKHLINRGKRHGFANIATSFANS